MVVLWEMNGRHDRIPGRGIADNTPPILSSVGSLLDRLVAIPRNIVNLGADIEEIGAVAIKAW
jgi:hypothetical protein